MDDDCMLSCLTSAIEYKSEGSILSEDVKRMEVAAEAREGRLLRLRQMFESCKL